MWSSLLVVLLGILPAPVASGTPAALAQAAPAALAQQAAPAPLAQTPQAPQAALPQAPQGAGAAGAAAAPQAASLGKVTTAEVEKLAALERERSQALAEKARLARQYEGQLQELDRLKQQRASWRRDRLIRDQLRASHETAAALAVVDQRIRRANAAVAAQRQRLVAAIDREVAAGPAAERRQVLARWRASAQPRQRQDVKKIVLPDERIDPLADPEELEDQAALLRQGEAELARELERLDEQAQRFRYMATLSAKRERAAELGRLDDDQPRRTTGRSGGGAAMAGDQGEVAIPGAPEAPPSTTPAPAPTPPIDGDDRGGPVDTLIGFDVVLADVVDGSTLDALRAADRSGNPSIKARAAERASEQVRARLERLRAQRKRIQERARDLRTE